MKIISTSLSVVIRHFPDQRKTVERLFQQHETFRLLSEDFCDSLRAMEYWRGLEGEKAVSIYEEYVDLIEDLSREISHWLEHHGASV